MAGDIATYRQKLIVGVTTAVLILAIVSCLLRWYARRISSATLWYDDYLMGAGLVRRDHPECHQKAHSNQVLRYYTMYL